MSSANRTEPKLWKRVKDEIMEGDRGGEQGEWSARKAQLAVQEYKKRGGGYEDDVDREDTDLHQWTEEDWGTRSGSDSAESGERYLPARVRMLLTEDEYRRSTSKKKQDSHDGDEQFSDQPDDVREKVAHIREHGPTREMLLERARELDLSGRSGMTSEELLEAIDEATDDDGRATRATRLGAMSRDELYEKAKSKDIDGRSSMSKTELVEALCALSDSD